MGKLLLIFALMLGQNLIASSVDQLRFITEDYPPYNHEERDGLQGYSVKIIAAMLEDVGSVLSIDDVELMAWAPAYDIALNQPNTALFSTTRTQAREHLFKWVGPLVPTRVVLLAKKDRNIRINTAQDISRYQTVGIREDIGHQTLLQLGVPSKRVILAATNTEAAQLIERNRADLWAYEESVGRWLMEDLGYNASAYEPVYLLHEARLYIALHKSTDDAIINTLQASIDRLRASGEIDRILGQ